MFCRSWIRKIFVKQSRSFARKSLCKRCGPGIKLTLEPLEDRLAPASFVVSTTGDLATDATTLRYAIANLDPGIAASTNTITFAPSLAGQTISLTTADGGELAINQGVTIIGLGADQLFVSGSNTSRVFDVTSSSAVVQISGLTIENGFAPGEGGAIFNTGTLTLTADAIVNSTAQGQAGSVSEGGGGGGAGLGGGVFNSSTLILQSSTLSGDQAIGGNGANGAIDSIGGGNGGNGGGPNGGVGSQAESGVPGGAGGYASGGGGGSSYPGAAGGAGGFGGGGGGGGDPGSASGGSGGFGAGSGGAGDQTGSYGGGGGGGGGGFGGALFSGAGASVTITNSTFADNTATGGAGGGNLQGGTAQGGNGGSGYGGAIFSNGSSITITSSTISTNSATAGAGASSGSGLVGGLYINGAAAVTVDSTIIAGNTASSGQVDVTGNFGNSGYDLIGSLAGGNGFNAATTIVGANPLLNPLGYYGGATQTMSLQAGSPALNAGDPTNGVTVDQRGAQRGPAGLDAGTAPDIGAWEASSSYLVTVASPDSSTVGTLRGAVEWANVSTNPLLGSPAANVILFDTTGVFATPQTISLTIAGDNTAGPSALGIAGDVEIDGPTGAGQGVTIARDSSIANLRLFFNDSGSTLTLDSLTVSGGQAEGGNGGNAEGDAGGGGGAAGLGGAIFNEGALNLRRSTLTGNTAVGGSGGNSNFNGVYYGGGGGGGGLGGNGGNGAADGTSAGGAGGGGGGTAGPGGDGATGTGGAGGPGGAGGAAGAGLHPGAAAGAGGGGGGSNSLGTASTPGNGGNAGFGGGGGGGTFSVNANYGGSAGFGGGGGGAGSYGGKNTGGAGGFGGGGGGAGRDYGIGGIAGFGAGPGGYGYEYGVGGGGGGAGLGGAVFNDGGAVTITDSTLAGNSAAGGYGGAASGGGQDGFSGSGYGGAVFTRNGTMTITNSTIAGNNANAGDGVFALGDGAASNVQMTNSIVASYSGGIVRSNSDFETEAIHGGGVSTGGNNDLIEDNNPSVGFEGASLITGVNPQLGPLADNGGPTQTMALLAGSPAINAGDNSAVANPPFSGPPFTDQRGQERISGAAVDMGAFESQIAVTAPASPQSGAEGVSTSFALGSFTSMNSSVSSWNVTVDWGDGTTDDTFVVNSQGSLGNLAHTYSASGPFTVAVTVADTVGDSGQAVFTANVTGSTLTTGPLTPPAATEGEPITNAVLFHFTDSDPNANVSNYTATVTWGDGTVETSSANPADVQVVANVNGGYDVIGAHTYLEEASGLTFSVSVLDTNGSTTSASDTTFSVADAPLTAGALTPPAATEGEPIMNAVLFHFTDANPNATVSDYTATVTWGDGTVQTSSANRTDVQVVANAGGGFDVVGSHIYLEEATGLTFSVSVLDAGGSTTSGMDSTFSVADAPLMAGLLTPPAPTAGVAITNAVLFHFTDANPNATISDYTATVTWGDGAVQTNIANPADVQVVANAGGGFNVVGSHTYLAAATGLTFSVSVADHGATPVGGSATIDVLSGSASNDIVVNGTANNDTLLVERTAGGPVGSITYILNGGTPVPLTGAQSFTFNGLGGDNTMTVSFANGGPLVPGGVVFNGGTGPNILIVDSAGNTVLTTPAGITVDNSQRISYTSVGTTSLNGAVSVDAFAGPDTADRSTAFTGLTAQERFVQALYLDDLGRSGAKSELDYWAAIFNTYGLSQQQAQTVIATGIGKSEEALDYLVKSWYLEYLGRAANGTEELSWVNELLQGQSQEQVLSQILSSSEFYARAQTLSSTGTADQRYVQALYELLLARQGGESDVADWISTLPKAGRQGIAMEFLQSQEFRSDDFTGYYNALLQRPADAAGLNSWVLGSLDMGEVRIGIESSPEFFTNG